MASGFDVEYVKSNLLRIPGIEVIEYASGITADECDCIVFVPEEGIDFSECGDEITIGRAATTAINDFIQDHPTGCASNVYIYTGNDNTGKSDGDCEPTTPIGFHCDNFELLDDSTFDAAGILYFSEYNDCTLLEFVSDEIGEDSFAWKKIPRHYKPAPEYAMPEVASVEERQSAKSAKYIAPEAAYVACSRRPLLGLRKAQRKS